MGNLTAWTQEAEVLLKLAESKYGPRDAAYSFLGVRVDPFGPHIRFTPDFRGVYIEINPAALPFPDQFRYQVAHEVIHLLAPVREPPACMLEEGLAVHFSIYVPNYAAREYRNLAIAHIVSDPASRNYRDTLTLLERLFAIEPAAVSLLRRKEPTFALMKPELIVEVIPSVSATLACDLCARRQMR
jgi:hypothetical protein